jgi:hypothetical protein
MILDVRFKRLWVVMVMDCLGSSKPLRVLAVLHLHAATNPEAALKSSDILKYIPEIGEDELRNILNNLLKLGYVSEVDGRYYLTHFGSIHLMSIYS